MTLSDVDEVACMEFTESCLKDVGKSVREVMTRACGEHRLTCGVVECARQLETEPDDVMLCILPEVSGQNVCIGIQHTLMEAYCREYDIQVLKVESVSSLSEILHKYVSSKPAVTTDYVTGAHSHLERKLSNTRDLSCFLVKNPDVMASNDLQLKMFCSQDTKNKAGLVQIPP